MTSMEDLIRDLPEPDSVKLDRIAATLSEISATLRTMDRRLERIESEAVTR